ncbi:MAG: bifunctional UDP-N-acetylglucosamine diphosphorylase/glucosamine-1-phosphate N-acetyltransferase GlmU [Bacillota bacterium]
MDQLWAVVLAAGEGKRMHSRLPKVLHQICGRPMLQYILESTMAVTEQIIVVVGHGAGSVRQELGSGWRYVFQEQQLGTGHAVACALPLMPDRGKLLVLCGDTPLLETRHLEQLLEEHSDNAVTLMTALLNEPTGYGRIIRDQNGHVERIVEEIDASPLEKKVPEINTGTYCFNLGPLKRFLPQLSADNAQGEYYLTDIIALLKEKGHKVGAYRVEDNRICLGINDRGQLAEAAALMRQRINHGLMQRGVTLIDPATTYIDYDVQIGSDTVIWPQTVIEGATKIGCACQIGPAVQLRASCLDDRVTLRQSVVEESIVETGAVIGPFAYIRPDCRIGQRVKIGDFVEVKNSNIGEGTKIPHLSYIGDADIQGGANLGAGVIIVNYDGRRKYRATIGTGAFVGCNSNLISPVEVGDGAYIAAGSTVTENVPPGALALARARQENKPGVAHRFLKKNDPVQEKGEKNEKA